MSDVTRLQEIVIRLRAPDGCPWDREQTHSTLRSALVEECYEVVEAINREDDPNLQEELGDILLHVVMHSRMAEERGAFTFEQVVDGVSDKLIRRHPHVFGDTSAADSQAVLKQWEQIKREEKGGDASILAGLPMALPALMRAQNAQKKAARVGFDWDSAAPVFDKVEEELAEIREALAQGDKAAIEEELGDLLFSVVNLARKLKVDSETALTGATGKFVARFQAVEIALAAQGQKIEDATPEEMNRLWDEHKRAAAAAQ